MLRRKIVSHQIPHSPSSAAELLSEFFRNEGVRALGTTRGSGHKTGSDQKWAESTQLRLTLLKGTEFPEIFCFLDRLDVSEFVSAMCQSDENVQLERK